MAEFLLVVAIPLLWGVWELVSLARHRPHATRTLPTRTDVEPSDGPTPSAEP